MSHCHTGHGAPQGDCPSDARWCYCPCTACVEARAREDATGAIAVRVNCTHSPSEIVASATGDAKSDAGLAACLIGAQAHREGLGTMAQIEVGAPYTTTSATYTCEVRFVAKRAANVEKLRGMIDDLIPRALDVKGGH